MFSTHRFKQLPSTPPARRSPGLWSLALGAVLLSHCNKQEPAPAAEASSAPSPTEAAAPSAVAPAKPAPTAEATPPTSASAAAGDPGACGEEGQPDCPLQAFMKQEVKAAQKAGDYEKLAAALQKVSSLGPAGYDEWSSFAKKAAEAATKKDADAVKAACKTCHKKYQDKFHEEHRAEKLL